MLQGMSNVAFDTLKLAKRLEDAGFAPDAAAATASAMGDAMTELHANLATKAEFNVFRSEMRHEFELVRRDLAALELRMTVKLGAMMAGAVGLTAALVKLL